MNKKKAQQKIVAVLEKKLNVTINISPINSSLYIILYIPYYIKDKRYVMSMHFLNTGEFRHCYWTSNIYKPTFFNDFLEMYKECTQNRKKPSSCTFCKYSFKNIKKKN